MSALMRDDLTEEQIQEFREAFSEFDKKGDGKVECVEVGDVLRAFGLNPSVAEVNKLKKDVDPKGNKRITFEEFLPIYHNMAKRDSVGSLDAFVECFRIFDIDNNGLISAGEIRHLLTVLGEKLTDREVEKLLYGHEDSMGKVHYEEFVKSVMNG